MNEPLKRIQLYVFYPVEGGCPKCGENIIMPTMATMVNGIRDFESTNCPYCNASLDIFIAEKNKKGKYKMVKLTELPDGARPTANIARARISDAKVIQMPTADKPKTEA